MCRAGRGLGRVVHVETWRGLVAMINYVIVIIKSIYVAQSR